MPCRRSTVRARSSASQNPLETNTDCTVKNAYSGQACPAPGDTNLIDDSVYDERNALIGYRYYNGAATASKTSDYTVDPLERPLTQVDKTAAPLPVTSTTYDFTYVGVTNALSKEILTGTGGTTKKYSYDVFGNRATITEGSNKYSYLYDPHSSVSVLIDQANVVKESYGYSAYGQANAALTKTATGFNASTNPYRYTSKRLDSGSGTYDMGARRYSASTGRFLQYDHYYNALDNLRLSQDPLTQNRYALAGANPVNYVEIDGHAAAYQPFVIGDGGPLGPEACVKQYGAGCYVDRGKSSWGWGDLLEIGLVVVGGGAAAITARIAVRVGLKLAGKAARPALKKIIDALESAPSAGRKVKEAYLVVKGQAGRVLNKINLGSYNQVQELTDCLQEAWSKPGVMVKVAAVLIQCGRLALQAIDNWRR